MSAPSVRAEAAASEPAALPSPALRSPAQRLALGALRVSLGLLMLVWGADKLVNPAHGMQVAEHFYFGLPAPRGAMAVAGALQIALGALVALGLVRRVAYPALAAVTGLTLLGVWRSVLDPWGWWLTGTNALFFPSLIVFAGVLVLLAFDAPRASRR
jgi:uncharacterized membrane protein YphA (DoxX/SURF4 family)